MICSMQLPRSGRLRPPAAAPSRIQTGRCVWWSPTLLDMRMISGEGKRGETE